MAAQAEPPETGEEEPQTSEEPYGPINIRRIEWGNLALVAVAAIGALLVTTKETALGIAIGGAIMATSFRIIAAVMESVFGRGKPRGWLMVLYWLKFGLMMGLIGVLIKIYGVDTVGLLLGISMLVLSIIVETLRSYMKL